MGHGNKFFNIQYQPAWDDQPESHPSLPLSAILNNKNWNLILPLGSRYYLNRLEYLCGRGAAIVWWNLRTLYLSNRKKLFHIGIIQQCICCPNLEMGIYPTIFWKVCDFLPNRIEVSPEWLTILETTLMHVFRYLQAQAPGYWTTFISIKGCISQHKLTKKRELTPRQEDSRIREWTVARSQVQEDGTLMEK